MAKLKFTKQERLTRGEAAARLAEIAEALRNSATFELERGGVKLELDVPEEVMLEFEVEVKDGKAELEVEVGWASVSAPVSSSGSESSA